MPSLQQVYSSDMPVLDVSNLWDLIVNQNLHTFDCVACLLISQEYINIMQEGLITRKNNRRTRMM